MKSSRANEYEADEFSFRLGYGNELCALLESCSGTKAKWLFANIFNYWTLSIQTAGSKTTLKMEFCPDVMQTSRKILNVVDNYRDEKNLKENPEY